MSTAVVTAATAEILDKLDWILDKFGIIFGSERFFKTWLVNTVPLLVLKLRKENGLIAMEIAYFS